MTRSSGVHEKGSLSVSEILNHLKKNESFKKAGAIAFFIGTVRGENLQGKEVQKLTLEAYEENADEILNKICSDLSKKPGIIDVQIHHFLGEFNVGEDLVYVSVAGSHRTDVFPTLREAVERYKSEAPIFKKERVLNVNGSALEYWVSERAHKAQ